MRGADSRVLASRREDYTCGPGKRDDPGDLVV